MVLIRTTVALCILAAAGLAVAEPVDGVWTSAIGLGNGPIFDANTNSPIVGDGSANSAEQEMLHSPFTPITLSSPGDRIVFTGSVTLSGTVGSPANQGNPRTQFRFGLFDGDSAPPDDTGWVGYYMSNRHGDASGAAGILALKPVGNTSMYLSTGGQQSLGSQAGDATTASLFHDGTYAMNLSIERNAASQLLISATLAGSNGFTQSINGIDAAASVGGTFTFDRLGFLLGGNLDADLAEFSDLNVEFNPVPQSLTLEVLASGPNAGAMRLANRTGAPLDIDYYEITSAAGSLDVNGWNSLDDQSAVMPPAGWHEAGGSDEFLLSEANILGSTVIPANGVLHLGRGFTPGGLEDLQFSIGLTDDGLTFGAVEYIEPGDFNGDGSVDAADLAVWETAFGSPDGADADFDGDSDGHDFLAWQRHLAEPATAAATLAVPEPMLMELSIAAAFFLASYYRAPS